MEIAAAIEAFFVAVGKILDKMPDWLQRKKDTWYDLQTRYNEEWNKPLPSSQEEFDALEDSEKRKFRDCNLADNLRIERDTFAKTFILELATNSVKES